MEPLLEVRNYRAHFYTRRGIVKAVDGLNFTVHRGETLGIVGESGSGKSVSQLSFLGLIPSPPLKIVGGEVLFRGKDILKMTPRDLRRIRGKSISMIFQEPMTSLNPYMRISAQLVEPLILHEKMTKKTALIKAQEALERVGIANAQKALASYPHEYSGGMRQRVMIAMALTTNPELLIADEPTTALDVTVQAQILDLLKDIQKDTKMAIIMITHDLGVMAGIADRVLVMYAGHILEEGTAEDIFYRSYQPYTLALLKSTPRIDIPQGKLPIIAGAPPDLSKLPPGCPFYERCDFKMNVCASAFPAAKQISAQHQSFCYLEGRPQ